MITNTMTRRYAGPDDDPRNSLYVPGLTSWKDLSLQEMGWSDSHFCKVHYSYFVKLLALIPFSSFTVHNGKSYLDCNTIRAKSHDTPTTRP